MVVTRVLFSGVLEMLLKEPELGLDTETTGLRMFHGDRLFSLILSTASEVYYFNFNIYVNIPPDFVLDSTYLDDMAPLFNDPARTWFIHKAANFDLPVLFKEKIDIKGTIHCTLAVARVEYNIQPSYTLASCLERIGERKSDEVEKYIQAHKLYEKVSVPGKKQRVEKKFFHRVPYDVIVPYGEQDGLGVFKLGKWQVERLRYLDSLQPELVTSGRTLTNVMNNERRLQKTVFRMKSRGVLIDRPYCDRAIAFERDREEKATDAFKRETGRAYSASPLLFRDVFGSEADQWTYTDKGNPSFDADALIKLENPAAQHVLALRDAKAKQDFYQGFLYHSTKEGILHPNFNPEGTVHGRFSSSEPNFQNLTNEEDEGPQEFSVRRAIIPRPGYILIMPDYKAMEYRFMLEMACRLGGHETELSRMLSEGMDFHDATRLNVQKVTGMDLPRKQIKIVNFMTLYGSGIQNIADTLKVSFEQAKTIKDAILEASPEVQKYMKALEKTASERGYIVNWMGRRCYFPFKSMSYKATNYHVSGGCADVTKKAMNEIDDYLLTKESKMVMTVHDEIPIEVHETELKSVPHHIKSLMEGSFTSKYVPLTVEMKWSSRSLGDAQKGFPV